MIAALVRLFVALNRASLFYLTPVCAIAFVVHQLGVPVTQAFVVTAVLFPAAVALYRNR